MAAGRRQASAFGSLPDAVKPREQLRDAPSAAALSDESLLAILLKTGSAGCDVMTAARRLIAAAGSTSALVRSDWRTAVRAAQEYNRRHPDAPLKGFGPVKALELQAAFELTRRAYAPGGDDIRCIAISTPEDACRIFRRSALAGDEQETFFVLPLDSKHRPLCEFPEKVTRGTATAAPAHAREVFKCAIRWGAQCVFLAHNHPSGDPAPSRDDIALTERLVASSRILGIPVLDHIVIGDPSRPHGGFVSLRREGLAEF